LPERSSKRGEADGGVVLRQGTADDAAAIHAMVRALARDLGSEERMHSTVEDFRRCGCGSPPTFDALLAERMGTPVGLCLYFASFSSWRGEPGVYLQDIWVAESERGTGLAQRMVAECARRAAAKGARYMRLSVDRGNDAARAFYTRLGLRHAAHECIYTATGAAFEALAHDNQLTVGQ
jgi:ribosomal protein S18 acetylase RimI-like enzyme